MVALASDAEQRFPNMRRFAMALRRAVVEKDAGLAKLTMPARSLTGIPAVALASAAALPGGANRRVGAAVADWPAVAQTGPLPRVPGETGRRNQWPAVSGDRDTGGGSACQRPGRQRHRAAQRLRLRRWPREQHGDHRQRCANRGQRSRSLRDEHRRGGDTGGERYHHRRDGDLGRRDLHGGRNTEPDGDHRARNAHRDGVAEPDRDEPPVPLPLSYSPSAVQRVSKLSCNVSANITTPTMTANIGWTWSRFDSVCPHWSMAVRAEMC